MVLADVLNRSMSRTQPVHRDDIDQQLEYTDALAVDTIHHGSPLQALQLF